MTLLCVAIIPSMVDLTTAHIRFTKKVKIGSSAEFASCGTVENIVTKSFFGRTCCVPFQHLNTMLFVSSKTFF